LVVDATDWHIQSQTAEGFNGNGYTATISQLHVNVGNQLVTFTFVFRFGQFFKSSRHEDGVTEEKERVQNG